MSLLTVLYISGGILLLMVLYRSIELLAGITIVPNRFRASGDFVTKRLVAKIVTSYNSFVFNGWHQIKKIPAFVGIILLSAWMWALRFTIKIVSLLQGRNGYVRSMVRGHLEAITDYKKHLREEDDEVDKM